MTRLKESDSIKSPLLIVDYYGGFYRCPICTKQQKIDGECHKGKLRNFTCHECNAKYGEVVEWPDNGNNKNTERCGGCRRLTRINNNGCCEGCSASCCQDCCGLRE